MTIEWFSWDRFFHNIPIILRFFPVTLRIVVVAEFFGILLALLIAVTRIDKIPVASQLFAVFVSFMRGTPMLIQMFIIYFGLPALVKGLFGDGIQDWDRLTYVFIAFALNQGAYLSEIYRAAILAIPKEQMEAGLSVGLTGLQTFCRIMLPQSVRIALPALGVDLVWLFQGTSIAFLVGVVDLMGRTRTLGANSGHYIESYVFIALVFIIISFIIKLVFYLLEKHILKR
jgi:L-cystine transport system permease protein